MMTTRTINEALYSAKRDVDAAMDTFKRAYSHAFRFAPMDDDTSRKMLACMEDAIRNLNNAAEELWSLDTE